MKMKQRKTVIMIVMTLVATLMVSAVSVNAANNSQYTLQKTKARIISVKNIKPMKVLAQKKACILASQCQYGNAEKIRKGVGIGNVQYIDNLELEELDDVNLDELVKKYNELSDDEKFHIKCVWVLYARGYSWPLEDIPDPTDTNAVDDRYPMVMKITARPVWDTGDGILFEVNRGIVGHKAEKYPVRGYGWFRKEDRKFYMRLDGEDIVLRAVGKVLGMNAAVTAKNCCRFYPVVMKGRMTVDGENYVFAMRGRVFRLCICSVEPVPIPEETNTLTIPS